MISTKLSVLLTDTYIFPLEPLTKTIPTYFHFTIYLLFLASTSQIMRIGLTRHKQLPPKFHMLQSLNLYDVPCYGVDMNQN